MAVIWYDGRPYDVGNNRSHLSNLAGEIASLTQESGWLWLRDLDDEDAIGVSLHIGPGTPIAIHWDDDEAELLREVFGLNEPAG